MTERQVGSRRRVVLIYLYSLFALSGVHTALTRTLAQTDSGLRIAENTLVALALARQLGFMWFCTLDAKLVGKPLLRLARVGIFLGWPVGVPVYLLWARRLRGLGLLVLHGFVLILVAAVSMLATGYLVYGRTFLD